LVSDHGGEEHDLNLSESDDEVVGEVHVAELYFELQCFSEAVRWLEKSWESFCQNMSNSFTKAYYEAYAAKIKVNRIIVVIDFGHVKMLVKFRKDNKN
jgi:hypothetical protein